LALAFVALGSAVLAASEHRGQVRFGAVPVHGATVQATREGKTVRAMTDPEGRYVLPDLGDGTWTIQVEMPGFETLRRDVTIVPDATPAQLDPGPLPHGDVPGDLQPHAEQGYQPADGADADRRRAGRRLLGERRAADRSRDGTAVS
jgi:hypothetical protein